MLFLSFVRKTKKKTSCFCINSIGNEHDENGQYIRCVCVFGHVGDTVRGMFSTTIRMWLYKKWSCVSAILLERARRLQSQAITFDILCVVSYASLSVSSLTISGDPLATEPPLISIHYTYRPFANTAIYWTQLHVLYGIMTQKHRLYIPNYPMNIYWEKETSRTLTVYLPQ